MKYPPKEEIAMKQPLRLLPLLLSTVLLCGFALPAVVGVSAAEDTVYLGDREDLFLGRDSLDGMGWNTAHSGEPITIGTQKFSKGLGFHCQPDRDAYVEFDISSLGLKYFSASVGVLKEAGYFIEWGSISFHVFGDGKLLASSPLVLWNEEPYFLTCSVEGVKTLRLVQKNENGHACDAGVWGNAALTNTKPENPSDVEGEPVPDPNKTDKPQPAELTEGDFAYLSDLYWMDNATYSGNVVGRDCNTANEIIISSDSKFYKKGVGFHAVSSQYAAFIDVNIEGLGYTKFAAHVGVSETLTAHDISMASVKFAVFGDGVKLWESGTVKFGMAMEPMECDVSGVKVLRLAVAGAPGISGAWGTFGGAVVSKSGNITEDMIFSNLTFDEIILPPETEPETEPSTEPETEPVTDSVTAPVTEEGTKAPAEPEDTAVSETPTETDADQKGCGAVLLPGCAAAALAAIPVLSKKKED